MNKILFICGCLEPGRDGVGDYVRKFSSMLMAKGIRCYLVAVHDSFLNEDFEIKDNSARIAAKMPWNQKIEFIAKIKHSFTPDLISIQFVAYSFNKRGLIFPTIPFLKNACKDIPVHIMLHELWIGLDPHSTLFDKIKGYAQRHFILKLMNKLGPALITTSNNFYKEILKRNDIKAEILPLISNIQVNPGFCYETFEKYTGIHQTHRGDYFCVTLFGSIHSGWDYIQIFESILLEVIAANKKLIVISIGKQGNGTVLWKELIRQFKDRVSWIATHSISEHEVSDLLFYSDAGLSTTPLHLLGKSGSVKAMSEHGLKILVVRNLYRGGYCYHPLPENIADLTQTPFNIESYLNYDHVVYHDKDNIVGNFLKLLNSNG